MGTSRKGVQAVGRVTEAGSKGIISKTATTTTTTNIMSSLSVVCVVLCVGLCSAVPVQESVSDEDVSKLVQEETETSQPSLVETLKETQERQIDALKKVEERQASKQFSSGTFRFC